MKQYNYMYVLTIQGMLSKSKGQLLRVAAVMHILFHIDSPDGIPERISENAVKAAECFVDLCLQHAAYLGGRGDFQDAVDDVQQGLFTSIIFVTMLVSNHSIFM